MKDAIKARDLMVIYREQVDKEIDRLAYVGGHRQTGNGAEDAMVSREKIVQRAEEAAERAYQDAASQLIELRNLLQHIPTPQQQDDSNE